ncbi:urease accessory protein UreD [Halioxenophilus sp. WMMB6]|uniref:urease accessory protein UreD n=1 Tax=Halioxenophilus sp. WMMB6 TaxID=3073815 RepID=UPI00295F2D84|nr:urease accessory protein UreD [Halioxenophilus sp. WMMB6]
MGLLEKANLSVGGSQWAASLHLQLGHTQRGTRLLQREHSGPLYVQKPFYPEGSDLAHIYLLHPPGGLVSGDHLQISAELAPGAQALFTTPGASRLYRARPDQALQRQVVSLQLANGSAVEWLPLETIAFPNSRGRLVTRVQLPQAEPQPTPESRAARFIGWEITCLGLPASGQPFTSGQLLQSFELWAGNKPLLLESLRLNASDQLLMAGAAGLQGRVASALMVAGPFAQAEPLADLIATLRAQLVNPDNHLGVTSRGQFIVIRALGDNANQLRQLLTRAWQLLRPALLERPACLPRIWAC